MKKESNLLAYVFFITLLFSFFFFALAIHARGLLPTGERFDDGRTIVACHLALLGLSLLSTALVTGLVITAERYRQRCNLPSFEAANWFESIVHNGCSVGMTLTAMTFVVSLFLSFLAINSPAGLSELSINHIQLLRYLLTTDIRDAAILSAAASVVFSLLAGVTKLVVFLRDLSSIPEMRAQK